MASTGATETSQARLIRAEESGRVSRVDLHSANLVSTKDVSIGVDYSSFLFFPPRTAEVNRRRILAAAG
jgi:hypothetical protein